MKKLLFIVIVILALGCAAVYLFVPAKLSISSVATFNANRQGVYRLLTNDKNWTKWWPGTLSKTDKDSLLFQYKNCDFKIEEFLYDAIRLSLNDGNDTSSALLKVVPFTKDSMGIEFSSDVNTGRNPFRRITAYSRAQATKHAMDTILLSLKRYAGRLQNIYGIEIKNEKVEFQHLISIKQTLQHYPSTSDIYSLVGKLRTYIDQSAAKELFYPMLNISITNNATYNVQVGMPVDRELPEKNGISSKWMMMGGNILTGEVTGGPKEIDNAKNQMESYIRDYQRSIIAIPFQMLITDRTKQADSTKWVTRLYYPVV